MRESKIAKKQKKNIQNNNITIYIHYLKTRQWQKAHGYYWLQHANELDFSEITKRNQTVSQLEVIGRAFRATARKT